MNGFTAWILLVFFVVVLISHVLEGITGFGSTALSLPLLSALMGIGLVKPVLMMYVAPLAVYILAKSWKAIDWRHYGRMVLMMALGVPIGVLLYTWLPEKPLLGLLSAFTIAVSARGLIGTVRASKDEDKKAPQEKRYKGTLQLALVWLGGIIHGAFASGGPLIIIYAAENVKGKTAFRATMCMMWLTVNVLMLAQMGFEGQLTTQVWTLALWGLPVLALGTWLGDKLHERVESAVFLRLSYGVLLASGLMTGANLIF